MHDYFNSSGFMHGRISEVNQYCFFANGFHSGIRHQALMRLLGNTYSTSDLMSFMEEEYAKLSPLRDLAQDEAIGAAKAYLVELHRRVAPEAYRITQLTDNYAPA